MTAMAPSRPANQAPDFPHYRTGEPSTYPSAGRHIGPVWQWIWDRLDNGPTSYKEIRAKVLGTWPVSEKTLINLLSAARQYGYVTTTREHQWANRTVKKGARG